VPQELRQLAIAHLLERENPVGALLPREGQPFQQLGPQLGVWVLLLRCPPPLRRIVGPAEI
jgi:hypothetical protein